MYDWLYFIIAKRELDGQILISKQITGSTDPLTADNTEQPLTRWTIVAKSHIQ